MGLPWSSALGKVGSKWDPLSHHCASPLARLTVWGLLPINGYSLSHSQYFSKKYGICKCLPVCTRSFYFRPSLNTEISSRKVLIDSRSCSQWSNTDLILSHCQVVGFFMGILRARNSDTVPIPVDTVPIMGMGTYHTVNPAVSYKTCGTFCTHRLFI